MEDFGATIFYIILGIIYFIFSLASGGNKKKKKPQPKRPNNPQAKTQNSSFEDLLSQISQEYQKQQPSQSQQQYTQPKYETLETLESYDDYYEEEGHTEMEDYKTALSSEERNQVLKDIMDKRDKQTKKSIKTTPSRYKKMFQNPETVKDAFIMSEIFKRKF